MKKYITGILCAGLTLGLACPAFAADEPTTPAKTAETATKPAGTESAHVSKLVEACSGKAAGDACSWTGRKGRTIEGTCKEGHKDSKKLMCHPEKVSAGAKEGKVSK